MADANLFPDEAGFTPRPAWQVIEAARRQFLTGELTLPTTPATRVYLRDGQVYFAERTSDGALPIRLMMEGVITREQMQRGTVIVNGVEHVGRMFESDPTIDRASVELCTELFTDDVMVAVANTMVKGYELALYRRHPSGIDRWYPHSVPVSGRQGDAQPASAPASRSAATEPAPKAAAPKPKPKAEAQPPQAAAQPAAQPAAAQPAQAAAPAKTEPKNNLNAPPITQAVPVTAPVASAVPPPPPITQAVPVTPPPTAQVPVTMPAPTAQIPVTQPRASAELDAAAIADEVALAIKRAFAGTGVGQ